MSAAISRNNPIFGHWLARCLRFSRHPQLVSRSIHTIPRPRRRWPPGALFEPQYGWLWNSQCFRQIAGYWVNLATQPLRLQNRPHSPVTAAAKLGTIGKESAALSLIRRARTVGVAYNAESIAGGQRFAPPIRIGKRTGAQPWYAWRFAQRRLGIMMEGQAVGYTYMSGAMFSGLPHSAHASINRH